MIIRVFIEPHERVDALEGYAGWLSPDQVDEIMDAPETALVSLKLTSIDGVRTCDLTVIEEG